MVCLCIVSHWSESAAGITGKLGDESSLKAIKTNSGISGGLDSHAFFVADG
jgi:hypothetical protein